MNGPKRGFSIGGFRGQRGGWGGLDFGGAPWSPRDYTGSQDVKVIFFGGGKKDDLVLLGGGITVRG